MSSANRERPILSQFFPGTNAPGERVRNNFAVRDRYLDVVYKVYPPGGMKQSEQDADFANIQYEMEHAELAAKLPKPFESVYLETHAPYTRRDGTEIIHGKPEAEGGDGFTHWNERTQRIE